MPDRCVHEFLPGQCAVCAGQELTEAEPYETVGQPFQARFEGRCTRCRRPIDPGDRIARDANSPGYLHTDCGDG